MKYFVCFLKITNSTSRIVVIVYNPVSKSLKCLNLMNTAFHVFLKKSHKAYINVDNIRAVKFSMILGYH